MSKVEIVELREKRASLFEEMKRLNDAAEAENRDLTAEEASKWDAMDSELASIGNRVERMERIEGVGPAMTRAEVIGEGGDGDEPLTRSRPTGTPEYRDAFTALLQARGAVSALDAEQRAALSVAPNAEGGYLVPDDFYRELVESERAFGVMRQLSRSIVTANNGDVQIPTLATRATAAWTAEEAAFTESESTFGQVVLQSFKVGAIAKISDELLLDSAFDMLSFLARDLGEAIGILENTAFVTGASGSTTTPEGIVKKATVGKTFAANNAITSDELIDVYHSVLNPYRANSVWVMKDSTVQVVRKLKDTTNQYLWQPGLQLGQPDLFLGRPLFIDPDMPAIGTIAESVLFGDVGRAYWIRDVEGISIKVLNELYAANGQVGFRVHRRTDGDLVDTAAVKIGKHPV